MNPFPKASGGSYRPLLVKLLNTTGLADLADKFANRSIQFGIVRTFTGSVQRLPELQKDIITLLDMQDNPVAGYYSYELKAGNVAVVLSAGAFVYNENNKKAIAYVAEQLGLDERKVFKSGELYLTS